MLLNISNSQPTEESSIISKGLINFDNKRFSLQIKYNEEIEILNGNISCISGSDSTNLLIVNHEGNADRRNVSCSPASVYSFPAIEEEVNDRPACLSLSGSHFNKTNGDQQDIRNSTQ